MPTKYRGQACTYTRGTLLASMGGNSFSYDADGLRLSKNGTNYTYINGKLMQEVGTRRISFGWGSDGIMGIECNDTSYFFRKNAFGDVTHIYDESGTLHAKYIYDAWGNHKVVDANGNEITDVNNIGNINPIRYRGYYYDTETKLYYLKARYYDPATGRFISQDNVSYLDPDHVMGLNLYLYCNNNPVMYTDPSGCFVLSSLALTLLIITGGATIGGAVHGGVSAGMAGGNVGDVFAGIGKGAVNGLVVGGGISLTIGGFAIGGTTVLGSMMVTYGMSITANMLEVAITQGKKSIYDGDSSWFIANDINNAMFANSWHILIGRPTLMSIPFYGTRLTSKIPKTLDILLWYKIVNPFSPTSFSQFAKLFLLDRAGPLSLIAGYFLTALQFISLIKAIFSTPDFDNSKWILY